MTQGNTGELELRVAQEVRERYFSYAMNRAPPTPTLWLLIGPSGSGKTTVQHLLEKQVSYLTPIEPYTDRRLRIGEVRALLDSIGRDIGDAERVLKNHWELNELLDDPRVKSHTRFRTSQGLDELVSEAVNPITWPVDRGDMLRTGIDYGADAVGRHFVDGSTIDRILEDRDVIVPTTSLKVIAKLRRMYPKAVIASLKSNSGLARARMKNDNRSSEEVIARYRLNGIRLGQYDWHGRRYGIIVNNHDEPPSFVASKVAYSMAWMRQHYDPDLPGFNMHELFVNNFQAAFSALSRGEGKITGDVLSFSTDIVDEYDKLRRQLCNGSEKPIPLPPEVRMRISEIKDLTGQGWAAGTKNGVRSIVLQPATDSGYTCPEFRFALGGLINFYLAQRHGILNKNPMLGPNDLLVQDYGLTDHKPQGTAVYAIRVSV